MSRAAKVAATPGAVVGGVLAGPMSGASTAAVDTWKKAQPGNPLTKVVTGGLSLGAGILGSAAEVAASPGGGVAAARALHDDGYYSPQSDDE